jgi:hypothetical protein
MSVECEDTQCELVQPFGVGIKVFDEPLEERGGCFVVILL